jgi:hypothetical protein
VFVDVTEKKMKKAGNSSGVTGAYIGRWVSGLMKGLFFHQNIANTASEKNEIRIGQVFHFVSHISYGLGIGLTLMAYYAVMA